MDNRIHYYLVLDTETANGLDDPLVYDIGGAVIDARGRVYETFSFTIRDIFVYERELMQTAYYASKIPSYVEEHHKGSRKMVSFYEARRHILNLMRAYHIIDVCAYNAHFDRNALNTTQRWLTKSKYRYFFPYNTNFICIWNMACQTICQRITYRRFCEQHELFSGNGHGTDKTARNISTSAENVYRYLLLQPDYEEEHKGIDDVKIEAYIFARCIAAKKKFPHGKGIRRNCWMDVKRTV